MQNLSKDESLKNALAIKLVSHFKGQYKNSIFLDSGPNRQNKLIYPSANTITFNTLTPSFQNDRNQTFINALPGSKGITCLAQSQNKKYLAWCEQTDTVPIIFLIDLADPQLKRRPLAAGQIKNKKYVSLTFNGTELSDPKFLVALTNGPDHNIVQWNFEKGKYFIHSLQKNQKIEKTIGGLEKFSQIFFYREEDTLVAMGKGNLKFFKISTQKLQIKDSPFARRQINERDYNFTSYCIMKENLIVGTDSGDLFYFAANGQFKAILLSSPGQNYSIETLLYLPNTNKSFLVGGSDGLLLLYEKSDSKDPKNIYIRSNRKFPIKEYRGRITSLMSTPKENDIFIGMNTGIILRMSLQKNEQSTIDYALQSFHTDNITGLDVCLRKSLVGTCSADRSVRIWNFLEKNNLQVVKNFDEKPLSLSFHPSGLHIIVTFPDKVRLINILENQLVSYKDLPIKNCYEVKFSHGGQLFAVVNNVMVQIFNFYTLDQPSHYQFKAQAGKFQTMTWQEDDLALYLGTSDGFVFFYKLQDPSVRLQILSVPGLSIKTIASIFVGKDEKQGLINERTVYASGIFGQSITDDNKCIYEVKITPKSEKEKERESFREQQNKYTCTNPTKIYTYSDVIRIAFLNSKKIMFYCTRNQDSGTIRYCKYPLHSTKQICEIEGHSKAINRLAITHDDNYIFSAGEEGQFICYDFKDKEYKVKIQIPDLSEQFLYSKPKLVSQKRQFDELRQDNAEAKEKRERALRESKAENERLVNEWNFKINEREKSEKQKYEKEVDLITQMEKEQSKKLSKLEVEHKEKRQAVEKDYSDKIQLEQTRFTELGKTRQAENKKFHEYIETVKNNHIKTKQRKQLQFKEELAKEKQQLQHFQRVFEDLKMKYEQEQEWDENEAQKDIKSKKQDNEGVIKDLIKENEKAESEKRFKKQTLDKYERDLQEQNHKLKHTHQDIEKIKQKHEQNLQKKQSQAKEIEEREKTIRDKVTRINELKKKTQELEKFKFVLDYKIKELKRDIGPREEEISKMKEQIANMNSQIIHFKRTNDNMNLIVKDLVSKRNGMDKEIEGLNDSQNKNLSLIKSFEYDVSEMYQNFIKDYKGLKAKVVEIYRKYVQEQNRKKADGVDQQKEFIKERAHLQSTVRGLKEKFKRKIELHEADNKRIMSQNQELISEINDLKRQKKNLKDDSMKRELIKQASIQLEEQRIAIEKEYENTQKTLRQLKVEYEKKVKRRKEGVEA